MKKKISSVLAMLLAVSMLLMMAACGSSSASSEAETAASEASEAAETVSEEPAAEAPAETEAEAVSVVEEPAASAEEPAEVPELEYTIPVNDDSISLSYWISWNPDLAAECAPADASVYKALEEQTGIHVEYVESSPFEQGEDFNLMIASGDYVDVFPASGSLTVEEAYAEDITIDLTPYMDTYLADYKAILESNDVYMNAATDSEGRYLGVLSMYDENVPCNYGLVIRKDWLDQLNLDMPETYDDYYNVLTAFKTELGADAAMQLGKYGVLNCGMMCNGFGINGYISDMDAPFYQVDGEVKFGPVQSEFKDYLTMINQWYSEGLVDQDFYNVSDPNTAPAEDVTSDNMGLWLVELARMHEFDSEFDSSSSFEIWPVQDAVQNAGEVNKLRAPSNMVEGGGDLISTTCEYPEVAALWLDYRYTDAGIQLLNYGVEGEGFNYNDEGEPVLSDLITSSSNLNFGLARYATVFLGYNEPERMWNTYTDAQMASIEIWKQGDNEYAYPAMASMTADESSEYSAAYSDINTYMEAEVVKFVTGERSLDEFDEFVATIEGIGLDTCIAAKQAALDRYLGA